MRKTVLNLRQDHLALISVLLMLIGSGHSGDPCARYSGNETVDDSTLPWNYCEEEVPNLHLICSGGLDDEWRNGSDSVEILTLCRWPEKSFDPEELLAKFPVLQNLSVLDSNLTRLTTAFPSTAKQLQNVRFNGTKLNELLNNAFSMLPALSLLDLRNNALSIINSTSLAGPSIQEVYLSDNPWKCCSEMSWILNLTTDPVASRIVDRDKLICTVMNYDRPLVPVIEIMEDLREQCLKTKNCSCELSYLLRGRGAAHWQLMSIVTVNCSSRNLTEMPEFLPKNTTTLYLSKNKIQDLSPLKTNPAYKNVQDVYLDDNEVESMDVLEGSDWLDQFRVFSLRGNRLTDLPPYAIENALQQSHQATRIFLGKNPWRCDCRFTPGYQELLTKRLSLIMDVHDIRCAKVKNDENSEKEIISLSRTAICTPPADWIQPLDVLNVVLASMIFLVFGKLIFDYWNFKRTGKLPWLVAKIP